VLPVGQIKPTVEAGLYSFPGSGDDALNIVPLQTGFRYLLQASDALHLWFAVYFHGDFVFGHAGDHFVGGMAIGGAEVRLGRAVLGLDAGYRFSQAPYSSVIVVAKVGFTVGRMGRPRPRR
jgi:hypothetical protein